MTDFTAARDDERFLLETLELELEGAYDGEPPNDGFGPWRAGLVALIVVLVGGTLGLLATLGVCAIVVFLG